MEFGAANNERQSSSIGNRKVSTNTNSKETETNQQQSLKQDLLLSELNSLAKEIALD